MSELKSFIPPLAVSRILATYSFEGGGYVAVVGDGKISTVEMLDMAQRLIDIKRAEIVRLASRSFLNTPSTEGCRSSEESGSDGSLAEQTTI